MLPAPQPQPRRRAGERQPCTGTGQRCASSRALRSRRVSRSKATRNRNIRTIRSRCVVGFTAGGGTDVAARVIAQKLSEAIGQSFVVENRAGASGLIASEQVAKVAGRRLHASWSAARPRSRSRPRSTRNSSSTSPRSFTGMAMIGISPLVAVVNADSPIKSITDLIAEAKAKNGTMNFASGGVGTTPHMAGELLGVQRRHQDGARRLSRRSARRERSARRADPVHVLQSVGGERQHRGRQAAGARRDQLQARAVAAERADRRGNLPGLRRRDLVRAGRAGRNAARGRGEDQRRDEEDRRDARTSSSASSRSA